MTDSIAISGYSHLAIVVDDLDAARGFYCGTLGFDELRRPEFGVPGMWLRVGELQLHFIESPTMPVPGPGFPHFAFHVRAGEWDSTMEALSSSGLSFVMEPSERGDFGTTVRAAFVSDPAGNVIEFTDVGPLAAI